MNSLSILLAPVIICFFTATSAAVNDHEYLIGDVSINCGSTENFATVDGREWIGDRHKKVSSSLQIKGSSTSSSIAGESIVSADQAQYKTARISRSQFSYTFHLNPGQKLIRLHFNPVSYRGFNRFKDLFTVEAGPFILLGKFSASLTADALGGNGKYFAKEFCINIEQNQRFEIIFNPNQGIQSPSGTYAFINGIEIISMPTHLSYFHSGAQVIGLNSPAHIYTYNHTALEIIHRQNVKPNDDFVNMYRSRTTIPKGKINNLDNITWKVAVDVGFRYLVRIHFCDLGLKIAKEDHVIFKILINGIRIDSNIHLVKKGNGNEFLEHKDYMTVIQGRKQDGKHNLLITIESTDELIVRNRPFKGFEILKLSNFDNSLASPNPQPLAHDLPFPTIQNLLLNVHRDQNIIAAVVITIITLVNIVVYKLRQLWEDNITEDEKKPSSRARRLFRCFSLEEIEAATKNFNDAFVIGKGGFGKVYKGIIDNGQETVAIKRLKYSSNQGEDEFWTEIETLSELRHVNLVSLIGYCNEQQEMILVYEYMIHGTVDDHLYKLAMGNNPSSFLSWNQRLSICIGAGRGIDYLHTGHGIIHRDVKTSNILLDENFIAKISDFGLAKLEIICESQNNASTNVKGTYGYVDPYYIRTHKLTRKSDIYAFGVVLLEVLCGRPALDHRVEDHQHSLVTWARENISKGDVEKIISSDIRGEILTDSLKAFLRVTASCLDDEPKQRPTMAQVVLQLEFALDLQKKPNSLVSEETSIANGSPWDIFLKSAISFIKKELEVSTSGTINTPFCINDQVINQIDKFLSLLSSVFPLHNFLHLEEHILRLQDPIFYARRNELLNERRDSLAVAEDYATEVKVSEFDWVTIQAATNGFSDSRIIGKGRGGTFYKAVLHTRQVVAVKRTESFRYRRSMSKLEIYYLSKYKHPNIMKLLGNFIHGEEMLLVYELMENTSLDVILFERHDQLPWRLYFNLIVGIAQGVCCLHQNPDFRRLYCKLEPCNIFLDNDMNPKITIDYCKTDANTLIIPSDYAPPEGYEANQIYASDIYSLGVLVLEILTRCKHSPSKQHLDLITLVRKLRIEGRALDLVGASMGIEFSSEEATRCVKIALLCTQFDPQHRPDISFVLGALHGDQELALELRLREAMIL